MSEPEPTPLSEIKQAIASLAADLREMAVLRWELVRLESRDALRALRSLAIALLVAGIAALTALPILAVALAEWCDGRLGLSRELWLLIFGLGLALGAAVGGFAAWRRFRQRFVGLEQTLEELREDAVWLKDWRQGVRPEDDAE